MDAARLRTELTQELDRLYLGAPIADLVACLEGIEQRIADHLKEAIIGSLKEIELSLTRLRGWGFAIDDHAYELLVDYRDITKEDTLAVLLVEPLSNEPPIRARCRIDGVGKYSRVEVMLPSRLSTHLELVTDLSKGLYEAGYAWVSEFLRAKVRELESALVTELYRAVRIALAGKPQLAESVWLVLIDQDRGTYLFDQHSSSKAIDVLSTKRDGKVRHSAAAMFLGLFSSDVPFELSFSRHTIPTGDCLRCDLSKADYVEGNTLHVLAEFVLHRSSVVDSKVVSIVPLVRDEQPFLIAAFSTTAEGEVLPVLRANLPEIKKVFGRHRSKARAFYYKLTRTWPWAVSPGAAGEFLAPIIKALT